ncbi:MAG: RHS repeat protein, partial [Deltaproteobacteria bacterium]|nr:RHS repeat protein [Deltaproteobacteria bacterium]
MSRTDAQAHITQYGYSLTNQLIKVIDPLQGVVNLEYSPTGKITGIIDPLNNGTSYGYDPMGRMTESASPDSGATLTVYNTDGTPAAGTNANGVTVALSYDQAGRPVKMSYPDHRQNVSLVYDSASSSNGKGRLTGLSDPSGNITSIKDALPGHTQTYSYDPLKRLAAAKGCPGDLEFTYDANGNRLSQKRHKTLYNYSYQGNRLLDSTDRLHKYDASGNTISNGMRNFVYNQANRLSQVLEHHHALGEYTYNAQGQRVIKESTADGDDDDRHSGDDSFTVFHYDLSGRLIAETNAGGKLVAEYIYLAGRPLALIKKD